MSLIATAFTGGAIAVDIVGHRYAGVDAAGSAFITGNGHVVVSRVVLINDISHQPLHTHRALVAIRRHQLGAIVNRRKYLAEKALEIAGVGRRPSGAGFIPQNFGGGAHVLQHH